eukprot:1329552-Prymnesium_polylepis.1
MPKRTACIWGTSTTAPTTSKPPPKKQTRSARKRSLMKGFRKRTRSASIRSARDQGSSINHPVA